MQAKYKTLPMILLLLFVLGVVNRVELIHAAPCSVAGLIQGDTTWSPAHCAPYIVTGNVIVDEDATLTIQPGTTLRFNRGTELRVRGELVARGTAGSKIAFTSNQANRAAGDWAGILFDDSSVDAIVSSINYVSGSIVQHATIEYAANGLNLTRAYPFITHNTVRFNERGIYADLYVFSGSDSVLHVINNRITDNGLTVTGFSSGAGIYDRGGRMYLSENVISRNRSTKNGGGIYLNPHWDDLVIIDGNTITDNVTATRSANFSGGGGIYARDGRLIIRNNFIVGNVAELSSGGDINFAGAKPRDVNNNVISHNRSKHGGGLFFSLVSAQGEIFNNSITNNVATVSGGGVLANLPALNTTLTFAYNSIYDNLANGQANDFTTGDKFKKDIVATNNWWGTTSRNSIENHIMHAVDDARLGLVVFEPFCTVVCEPLQVERVFLPIVFD